MSTKRLIARTVAFTAALNAVIVGLVVAFRPADEDVYAVGGLLVLVALAALAGVMVAVRVRGGHPLDRIARGPRRHPL
jgi:hypothetical protein